MDSKDKQAKKFTVSTNRFRQGNQNLPFPDSDCIFNSTAKNPNDLISNDADISNITSLLSGSDLKCGFDLHVQHKTTASNEIIAHSNDINVKQIELDCAYDRYIMALTMKEELKKKFKEDEDNFIRDMFELHKCCETLRKTCDELDYEENVLKNLIEFVQLMNTTIDWIDNNSDQLNNFQSNFLKLSELCSKANKYLKIENIRLDGLDFEETVATEIRQTISILNKLNSFFDEKLFIPVPDTHLDDKFDYVLIKELKNQYEKLKICLLEYSSLRIMDNTKL